MRATRSLNAVDSIPVQLDALIEPNFFVQSSTGAISVCVCLPAQWECMPSGSSRYHVCDNAALVNKTVSGCCKCINSKGIGRQPYMCVMPAEQPDFINPVGVLYVTAYVCVVQSYHQGWVMFANTMKVTPPGSFQPKS